MKTIKMTVRHGDTIETATGTGATIHEAITALKAKPRLGGYVIDNTREAYPSFADTLETSGRAQHGWADYEIVTRKRKEWTHEEDQGTPDGEPLRLIKEGDQEIAYYVSPSHAARIVACVNACEGMADPAAEIKRLRDALKMAIEWSKEVPDPYREFPFIAAARAALGVQP